MSNTPPPFRFGLFGLRRAGKSVFLAALHAERRPLSNGSTITYYDTEPPLLPGMTEEELGRRKGRAKSLYLENARGLGQGRLPAATETAEGVTCHRFSLTFCVEPAPGASRTVNVELLDYAGELLKAEADETEIKDLLLRVLSETDGLIILAETPTRAENGADGYSIQPLNELASAFQKLRSLDPASDLLSAALLVTKWDRILPFDTSRDSIESEADFRAREQREEEIHRTEFSRWLTDAPEAGRLRELDRVLRGAFRPDDYSVWPTSAFGVSRLVPLPNTDGQNNEICARSELPSLNLVEPLSFLVDRARAHHRANIERLVPGDGTPSPTIPTDEQIVSEHGNDPALLNHIRAIRSAAIAAEDVEQQVRQAAQKQRRRRSQRWSVAGLLTVAVLAGVGFYMKQNAHVAALLNDAPVAISSDDLSQVIAMHDRIRSETSERPLLGPFLAPEDRTALSLKLATRECELWSRKIAQGTVEIELARTRQKILPECATLDASLLQDQERAWQANLTQARDALARLATTQSCEHPAFNAATLDSAYKEIQAILDAAPSGSDTTLLDAARKQSSEQRDMCLGWQLDGALKRDQIRAEGQLLLQQKWRDFFAAQKDFLDRANDVDQSRRLKLVQAGLNRLEQTMRDWREVGEPASDPDQSLSSARQLVREIDALKGHYSTELGEQLDTLRATVAEVETRLDGEAMCRAIDTVRAGYSNMQRDLKARDPASIQILEDALVELIPWGSKTAPLVNEVRSILGRDLLRITIESVDIEGNLPHSDRANRHVQAKLELGENVIRIDWGTATTENGFRLTDQTRRELGTGDIVLKLAVERYTRTSGNRYFGGTAAIDRKQVFARLTNSNGLTARLDLPVQILKDENAESLDAVNTAPTTGERVTVRLSLLARKLPDLKDVPPCPAD